MAGISKEHPHPVEIVVHQASRELEIGFDSHERFRISFEMLRVYSPSAEVRGHGPGQETLQIGKENVDITTLEPIGNYAVRPHFSDGHDSGLFSWDYLYHLGRNQERLWKEYLVRLAAAGVVRDAAPVAAAVTTVASSADPSESPANVAAEFREARRQR